MTEPQTREEWIEFHKQERVAEGLSLADQEMLGALFAAAWLEKIARCTMGEANDKGRVKFIPHGEPGPAETKWQEIAAQYKKTRVVKGGPLIGQEF